MRATNVGATCPPRPASVPGDRGRHRNCLIPLTISVLSLTDSRTHVAIAQPDMARVGIHCGGAVDSDELVRAAMQEAPDVLRAFFYLPTASAT